MPSQMPMLGKITGVPPAMLTPRITRLDDLVEMDVAGRDLVEGIDDADDGLFDLATGVAHRIEERSVLGPLQPALHQVTAHGSSYRWSVAGQVQDRRAPRQGVAGSRPASRAICTAFSTWSQLPCDLVRLTWSI